MIIDVHTHLGNILYPNGGKLIEQKGVTKKLVIDPISLSEMLLHLDVGAIDFESWLGRLIVKADRERNLTATRDNMRTAMNKYHVDYCAVMPIPPYVTFSDLCKAAKEDAGIIPFTGVDYTKEYDLEAAFDDDVKNGAKGIKLHPIIQNTPLTSKKTFEAVEAFSKHDLPILFHSGISHYYLDEEGKKMSNPNYGEIHYARDLVKAFPNAKFIAGHSGLFQIQDVIDMLSPFKNVWVDVSFQSPKHIRKLIEVFGPNKVLNGSDWPWGKMKASIKTVKWTCKKDEGLLRRIYYENAAELMEINIQ